MAGALRLCLSPREGEQGVLWLWSLLYLQGPSELERPLRFLFLGVKAFLNTSISAEPSLSEPPAPQPSALEQDLCVLLA